MMRIKLSFECYGLSAFAIFTDSEREQIIQNTSDLLNLLILMNLLIIIEIFVNHVKHTHIQLLHTYITVYLNHNSIGKVIQNSGLF